MICYWRTVNFVEERWVSTEKWWCVFIEGLVMAPMQPRAGAEPFFIDCSFWLKVPDTCCMVSIQKPRILDWKMRNFDWKTRSFGFKRRWLLSRLYDRRCLQPWFSIRKRRFFNRKMKILRLKTMMILGRPGDFRATYPSETCVYPTAGRDCTGRYVPTPASQHTCRPMNSMVFYVH